MKTGINLGLCSNLVSPQDIIPMVADTGFDACFWDAVPGGQPTMAQIARRIREHNLIFQSVHAPFGDVDKLWQAGERGDRELASLIDWTRQCADQQVPIMICHVWIGFGEPKPNNIGIDRFGQLLLEAEKLGVKIAFENTEGEAYLQAVRDQLWSSPTAGFCIDTGHEMCYNHSRDLIGEYGANGKLIATHLNDNLGITGNEITWLDDSHLFPFDGVADWEGIARRLKQAGYRDILTFELTNRNKPDRSTHDRYAHLSAEDLLKLAHSKALQFAAMMD